MEFDKEKYKVWKLPHPMLLHWILNPGIAINELVLGQRIPKVTLIDKTSDAPLMERQSIPCPGCNALNDARLWSKGNTFGHWFGLICPNCHRKIPCLLNITSLLILGLTFPIWIWLKKYGEAKWLEKEKKRFSNVVSSGMPLAKNTSWLKIGISFGVFMFCASVLPKVFQNLLSPSAIAIQAIIWLGVGLVFGVLMKLILSSRK
jgi:hypothetical protein